MRFSRCLTRVQPICLFWWLISACGEFDTGVIGSAYTGLDEQEEHHFTIKPSAFCEVVPNPTLVDESYLVRGFDLGKNRDLLVTIKDGSGSRHFSTQTNPQQQLSIQTSSTTAGPGRVLVSFKKGNDGLRSAVECSFDVAEDLACGNGECEVEEGCDICPEDCGECGSVCGDGRCESDEGCDDCAEDCGPCAPYCGDGHCGGGETCDDCEIDCGPCPPSCGDGVCGDAEDCESCELDCGGCFTCGDGVCGVAEDCESCELDCGTCPTCGDGFCDLEESCASCAHDCCSSSTVEAVATFESIGLYWSPSGGSVSNVCQVRFHQAGTDPWKEALDLWFDDRNNEYRGSIVHLRANTLYEIQLSLTETGLGETIMVRTRSDNFPIGQIIHLPDSSDQTLSINQGGSSNGYLLYTPAPGHSATIDVGNNRETCVDINAPYVILRGLTLRGAQVNGININSGAHDVVVEDCDISGWGRSRDSSGDMDAGIGYGDKWNSAGHNPSIDRVTIQRNKIHHPRHGANSWVPTAGEGHVHPMGPHALTFYTCGGEFVIRYNEIFSDEDHQFNDAIGAGSNYSGEGFPNHDSDIYGNVISMAWDDGIEAEGGGSERPDLGKLY